MLALVLGSFEGVSTARVIILATVKPGQHKVRNKPSPKTMLAGEVIEDFLADFGGERVDGGWDGGGGL